MTQLNLLDESQSSLTDINLCLWVLHTEDFHVLKRPRTKTFVLERKNLPCAIGFRAVVKRGLI